MIVSWLLTSFQLSGNLHQKFRNLSLRSKNIFKKSQILKEKVLKISQIFSNFQSPKESPNCGVGTGSATNCRCIQIRKFKERFQNENKEDKTMVISRDPENPKVDIKVDETAIEQVETFKYLGQTITSDSRSYTAMKQCIEIARQTLLNMSDVLTARGIEIETRKRLARCHVLSTL